MIDFVESHNTGICLNKGSFKAKLFLLKVWKVQIMLLTFFLLLQSIQLFSQNVKETQLNELFSMSLEELMNVEITTAGKAPQKVSETPASVVVITRDDIEKYGYSNLSEIIESVPGLYKINDWTMQGDNFGIRGFWNNQFNRNIIFLVDGIKQQEDVFGWTEMSSINVPVEAIDRIEVIRGPMSVIYGSGAFFGVINIITRNDTEGGSNNIASATYGMESTQQLTSRFSGQEGDLKYAFNASVYKTNGLDEPFSKMVDLVELSDGSFTTNASTKNHFKRNSRYFNFSGEFKNFYTDISYTDIQMNWIGYLPPIADQFTEAFNTFFRLGMGYKKKLSDILTVDGKLSYNYGEPATAIPRWINTNLMQLERDHFRTYNAELNAFIKLLPNLKITTGINYNSIFDIRIILDNIPLGIENTYFFIENPIKTLEYFFQANYEIKGNLFFVAGVRFNKQQKYNIIERHSSGLDDQVELNYDYEDNNLLVIPRFAIIYSLNNNNIFKFLYGEAINRPSFFENVQWGYHPVLVPQRIKTLEVNYLANLSSQLSTSLSVFHNQLDKLIERSIVWDESSQIYESYQSNAGEKSTIGAEFVLQSKPTNNLNFELSFTYQNTKNKRNKDVNVGYSPNLLGHLKATYNFNANMIISLTGNYVSEMEALWDTSPQNPSDINSPAKGRIGNKVDGYFNLGTNIRINNLFNSKFYLNAKVSNLLNTDIYYPTTTYSSWTKNGTLASGRGFNLTLGWRF